MLPPPNPPGLASVGAPTFPALPSGKWAAKPAGHGAGRGWRLRGAGGANGYGRSDKRRRQNAARAKAPSGPLFIAAGCLSVRVVPQDGLLGADNEALAYVVWLRVNGR